MMIPIIREIEPAPVGIDLEPALERLNVLGARYTIMHDGKLLPVTNLYDSDGNETPNNFHAASCVAYDNQLPDGRWLCIGNLDPGDVLERLNVEVPR